MEVFVVEPNRTPKPAPGQPSSAGGVTRATGKLRAANGHGRAGPLTMPAQDLEAATPGRARARPVGEHPDHVGAGSRRRIVIALGGNAMTGPDGKVTPAAEQAAVELSMERVAALLAAGHQVVLTHGNGPQVGNLVVQNELARGVVPPVPLHWCVAQTQATIGMLIMTALERAMAAYGLDRPVTALVSRVLVDSGDPAWQHPTKPSGEYLDEARAQASLAEGKQLERRGSRGWRRVVPSPEPRELVDAEVLRLLVEQGVVVVAGGGGGIPVIREEGHLRGVDAVLDKDLTAALIAEVVGADSLVIATDVEQVSTHFGTPEQRPIGKVTPSALRALADEGHFASGSMGPKVEAAIRFVSASPRANDSSSGNGANGHAAGAAGQVAQANHPRRAVITSLARLADAVTGDAGTVVELTD
jgi:carbamate kinase